MVYHKKKHHSRHKNKHHKYHSKHKQKHHKAHVKNKTQVIVTTNTVDIGQIEKKSFVTNKKITPKKLIAPIGLVLLLILSTLPTKLTLFGIAPTLDIILKYFIFKTLNELLFVTILIITIWFGFKHWIYFSKLFRKRKFFRKNRKLVKRLVKAVIILIFIFNLNVLTEFSIWIHLATFITILSVGLLFTIIVLRKVNSIDLRSDLNCWILRIGGVVILLSTAIFWLGSIIGIMVAMGYSYYYGRIMLNLNDYIFFTVLICITLIAIFCIFRSNRRFAMVGIWH
jgi:hypothetical protein